MSSASLRMGDGSCILHACICVQLQEALWQEGRWALPHIWLDCRKTLVVAGTMEDHGVSVLLIRTRRDA